MTSAFDTKDLIARLEKIGLPVAEAAAKALTKEVFAWVSDSCALKGSYFAMAIPLLPLLEAQLENLENKIDPSA